jgi:hypothetical protein
MMKKLIIVLLVFMSLFINSCRKSDPETQLHKNTFSAFVNGKEFVPTGIEVAISGSTLPGTRAVHVFAKDQNNHQLSLYLYEYNGIKTLFSLSLMPGSGGSYCIQDCGYLYSVVLSGSSSGEIKIISFDKTSQKNGDVVTGTFQFEADGNAGKHSITNGHFSVLVPN